MRPARVSQLRTQFRRERIIYHYFPDRYAFELLAGVAGSGVSVATLKGSRFARLLTRPTVKEFLAGRGAGVITALDLLGHWPTRPSAYVLTLGEWGDRDTDDWDREWDQTCRPGLNLVIQINFSGEHDRQYQKHLGADDPGHFATCAHPINRTGRRTLSWARVDLSESGDEALVEEIQSDWVRLASRAYGTVDSGDIYSRRSPQWRGDATVRDLHRYMTEVLARHSESWEEATLSATVDFLRGKLGVKRVWYHSVESGLRLNGFGARGGQGQPPRRLYSALPRRFGFQRTKEAPEFLREDADGYLRYELNRRRLWWHRLDL